MKCIIQGFSYSATSDGKGRRRGVSDKPVCVLLCKTGTIWGGDNIKGGMGWLANYGASETKSSHAEPSCRLNGLTEGTVSIEKGSLVQNLTTCIEKDAFL